MKMKKKIGAVLVCQLNHTNYGSCLQAYATISVVKRLGYDLSLIQYKKQRSILDWLKIGPPLIFTGGIESLQNSYKRWSNIRKYPTYFANQKIRLDKTNQFKEKEFVPLYRTYAGYDNLRLGSKEYDAVFVGSDQVWKPWGFYSGYWNLMFVDDSIPKFSYAASYGVSNIPWLQHKGTKIYLERLDVISVRELQGKAIVETYSDKTAQVVADPTMLFSKEEWEEFGDKATIEIPKDKYIFCYFLGPREDIRKEAIKLAEQTGLKLVVMRHMDEYVPIEETMGDYAPYDVDARDFIQLLRNAECVLTDSFHGTILSIILNKKFTTFYRVHPTNSRSTHSRIDSLLSLFNLESRKYNGELTEVFKDIDYSRVDRIRYKLREESLTFLEKALSLSTTCKQVINNL